MLKRTKGRFLLTMLVITGLAGTIRDTSLTKQERKSVITDLKETRSELFKSIKGLSEAQLNFKPAPDRWSIKECVYHISLAEKKLGAQLEAALKDPATPEKRAEVKVSDDELVAMVRDREHKAQAAEMLRPEKAEWLTMNDALLDFKAERANRIKYAKSTTEDFRDHFIQMPFGWIDAYQFMLLISAHSGRHTQQIHEIKNDPHFPRQ